MALCHTAGARRHVAMPTVRSPNHTRARRINAGFKDLEKKSLRYFTKKLPCDSFNLSVKSNLPLIAFAL